MQASIIVVLAANGNAARFIAKYRPEQPIIVGVVPRGRRDAIGFTAKAAASEQVCARCQLR